MFNKFKMADGVSVTPGINMDTFSMEGFSTADTQLNGIVGTTAEEDFSTSSLDVNEFSTAGDNQDITDAGSLGNLTAFKAIAKEMAEKAEVEFDDTMEIEDSAALLEFFENSIISKKASNMVNEKFKSAKPEVKLFLDIREHFDDEVEALKYTDIVSSLADITEDDLEDETLAKAVYTDYLTNVKKMSKEEADEEISDLDSRGLLLSKAPLAKDKLSDFYSGLLTTKKASKIANLKKEEDARKSELEAVIGTFDKLESIATLKMTDELKKAVKKNFLTPVSKEGNITLNDFATKQNKNKAEITAAIEVLNTLGLFNVSKEGKWAPDFTKVSSILNKKIKSELDDLITSGQREGSVGGTQTSMDALYKKLGYSSQ
jgi:hypothetical protein